MIKYLIVLGTLGTMFYFYKRSKSYYFFEHTAEDWKTAEQLLRLKGRSEKDIQRYKTAYLYFIANPHQYDGTTFLKDLYDIPGLCLDSMLHDYESIMFASYSYRAWNKSAWDYMNNMMYNGKGYKVGRFVGLLIIGIPFVTYRKLNNYNMKTLLTKIKGFIAKAKNFIKVPVDRQLHFLYGDTISFAVMLYLLLLHQELRLWEVVTLGLISALLAGWAKEVWDGGTPGNFFDRKDLYATIYGGLYAIFRIIIIYLYLYNCIR